MMIVTFSLERKSNQKVQGKPAYRQAGPIVPRVFPCLRAAKAKS
ncbi:MAG TPA: hypothetical protein VFT78_07980 [Hanamia sp.]|nr:hypothetical protein [Hanamia sp.]